MSDDQPAVPIGVRGVGWVLVIAGVLYGVIGTVGVLDEARTEALIGIVMLGFGVACLLVGRGLLRGSRRAYIAAIVLLAAAAVFGVARAVIENDRSLVSQAFLPCVALWILLRAEPRAHFARPVNSG
jgi:lysylphosphatidylglycerol synthetase-like protein (DUF2156 family)